MKKIYGFLKIISVLLSAAILLSCIGVGALAAGRTSFNGRIYADEAVDLSGIRLDVYGAKLSFDGEGFQKYNNEYLFSVYTEKNGAFGFERPSGMFVIRADMSTLPKKTGITENMWTVPDKTVKTVSAEVKRIAGINIGCRNAESGEIEVYIMSADNRQIYCDYTVDVSKTTVTQTADELTGKRTFRTERKVTIRANGTKKTHILTSESTETAVPVVSLEKPEYSDPRYYTESGGFFTVRYDGQQYSLQTVKNIYAVFEDAKAFYDKYGFKAPKKESGSKKFNIYLVTSGVASATTRFLEDGGGYIILQAPRAYVRTTHVFITSVIAHELFHAIMNGYTRIYGVVPSKWFREAFANWAGMQFLGYSSQTPATYINIFQSDPELPLTDTYDSRVYGAMLFALTVSEYYGGVDTVRLILEQFKGISASDKEPEITAINKALAKANGGSFKKAFMRFALNNMRPSLFYSISGSGAWNSAKRNAVIRRETVFRNIECKPLSTRYYDISGSGGKSAYITLFDRAGKYSDTGTCFMINGKSGSPSCFYDNVKSFCTYKIKDLSALKSTAASFGVINASTSVTQRMDVKVIYGSR